MYTGSVYGVTDAVPGRGGALISTKSLPAAFQRFPPKPKMDSPERRLWRYVLYIGRMIDWAKLGGVCS